jgi:nitrogen-specific signal transduction histidine kinase
MQTDNKKQIGSDFFERSWEESWTYIKTVVDVVHEPVLILDAEFHVIAANWPFYQMFHVEQKDTEGKIVYELGNVQWNIPALKKLLENILPKHTFFKGFEVSHSFPLIGQKIMILNARQIHVKRENTSESLPAIILLAIEDVTDMMDVAKQLADHTNKFEIKITERTLQMDRHISSLEKEIGDLKKGYKM